MSQCGTRLAYYEREPRFIEERINIGVMKALSGSDTYYSRNLFHNTFVCRQCGPSVTTDKHCQKCRRNALRILRFWRRHRDRRRLVERVMALNVMSNMLDVSEMGINANVLSFL